VIRALVLAALAVAAPAAARGRVEVPVRLAVQADGTRRPVVVLRLDGRLVDAALDPETTGLRVFPRALSAERAAANGRAVSVEAARGVRQTGRLLDALVGLGGAGDRLVAVARIEAIACVPPRLDCPRIDAPGPAAVLGLGADADAALPSPLAAVARRWRYDPPAPGRAGRLVLDPAPGEAAPAGARAFTAPTEE
jgi:hypothetical protein